MATTDLERELAAAQAALARTQRLCSVGELAAGLAHDLRNTLGGLQLRARLASQQAVRGDQRENLEIIGRVLGDAVGSLGRLQDLARGKRGRGAGKADLREVIDDAVALVRSQPKLRVEARLPDLPRVAGSAAELKHVFVGLLINARDAMPRGGLVRIAARRSGGKVVVTVADEGRGIGPGLHERIFEPFFTTKGKRGAGLGLSVARQEMQRLGGRISASNAPAGGAVFRLEFPVV
ncbi:MAG TPA: HAMP domain-containing sensor histidine kinase [Myxococcales bacterium]|nr:HAMP domain-containing sensor histidine kinase [Myxococcales bacterium]